MKHIAIFALLGCFSLKAMDKNSIGMPLPSTSASSSEDSFGPIGMGVILQVGGMLLSPLLSPVLSAAGTRLSERFFHDAQIASKRTEGQLARCVYTHRLESVERVPAPCEQLAIKLLEAEGQHGYDLILDMLKKANGLQKGK